MLVKVRLMRVTSLRTCIGHGTQRGYPVPKSDLIPMHPPPRDISLLAAQLHQLPVLLAPGQQQPRLLKRLPHGREPIRQAVPVPLRRARGGDLAVVEGVQVAAGEDVRRGKGRGGLDAAEQEDVVLGERRRTEALGRGSLRGRLSAGEEEE